MGAVAVVAAVSFIGVSAVGGGEGNSSPGKGAVIAKTTPSTVTPGTSTHATTQGVISSWVQAENAKPGTTAWALTRPSTGHEIEGYADQVSIDLGGQVGLYISTTAPTFTIEGYRMGYYGGTQGRLVWTSPTMTGMRQATCPLTAAVRMVSCSWVKTLEVQADVKDWPQGDYLFKLMGSNGYQSYVPLTIRDDASHAAYLINNSVTTWQAYNSYGNYSLYSGPTSSGGMALADRSYVVSFDRPYAFGNGGGDFEGIELRMVSLAESLGLDVTYTTDIDLQVAPQLLTQHRVFVSLGHDEYYSLAMRSGLQAARDAGVNLLFMGANALYRHIRLQPSPLGPNREEVDYKDPSLDPLDGIDNADTTPAAWRSPPNNNPESAILGEMWRCNPVQADMVITDPGNWMFVGTGIVAGQHLAGVVGPEYDSYRSGDPGPPDVEIVAHSPVKCVGRSDFADMTYYTAPSGAGVIDSGSIDFIGGVYTSPPPGSPAVEVTQITKNILAVFGEGPAGLRHPSVANANSVTNG